MVLSNGAGSAAFGDGPERCWLMDIRVWCQKYAKKICQKCICKTLLLPKCLKTGIFHLLGRQGVVLGLIKFPRPSPPPNRLLAIRLSSSSPRRSSAKIGPVWIVDGLVVKYAVPISAPMKFAREKLPTNKNVKKKGMRKWNWKENLLEESAFWRERAPLLGT
jgi:hypothetical protein